MSSLPFERQLGLPHPSAYGGIDPATDSCLHLFPLVPLGHPVQSPACLNLLPADRRPSAAPSALPSAQWPLHCPHGSPATTRDSFWAPQGLRPQLGPSHLLIVQSGPQLPSSPLCTSLGEVRLWPRLTVWEPPASVPVSSSGTWGQKPDLRVPPSVGTNPEQQRCSLLILPFQMLDFWASTATLRGTGMSSQPVLDSSWPQPGPPVVAALRGMVFH